MKTLFRLTASTRTDHAMPCPWQTSGRYNKEICKQIVNLLKLKNTYNNSCLEIRVTDTEKPSNSTTNFLLRASLSITPVIFFFILSQVEANGSAELWIKAIHVIAVISWMAGMLYLPRLFVYHCRVEQGTEQSETFKIMERRLLRYIMNPAMIATWITGLWLSWKIFAFYGGWLHLKLGIVFLLSGFHVFLAYATQNFAQDHNTFSQRTWRVLNEIPTLLMIVAVIAVILKIP